MKRLALIAALVLGVNFGLAQTPPGQNLNVPNSSSGAGSVTPGSTTTTCGTTQILFALAGLVSCDSGLTYAGSSGPFETGVGSVTNPAIANNVSPTSGIYYSANGLGTGISSNGVNKFDCLITTGSTCTVPTGVNFTVTTGTVSIPSLGLSGGGNITFSTRSIITSNSADGGFKVSNNAGTQSWTAATSATAGQVVFGAGIAATLATATGADVVCNAGTGGSPLTLQVSATGCAASSARFKESIASLNRQKALDDVLKFEPVSYFYKPEFNMGSDKHVGFTAEQIGSVDPQWITYEDDGVTPHAVKYNEMAPLLAAAIQQLKADNDNLRAELSEIKSQMARR